MLFIFDMGGVVTSTAGSDIIEKIQVKVHTEQIKA